MRRIDSHRARRAFTLTELLVAIGIIALLIGILLPALNAVSQRSKRTATLAMMQQFANACDLFQQQLEYPPGVVPEDVLAFDAGANGGIAKLSGTENALLHLMGGAVRDDDVDAAQWNALTPGNGWGAISFAKPGGGTLTVKINVNEMTNGRGPIIAGKQYERFFSAKPNELLAVQGQAAQGGNEIDFDPSAAGVQGLPDLVDSWGQPLMFARAARSTGPLAGDVVNGNPPAQFGLYAFSPYAASAFLGELGRDQTQESVFNTATGAEAGTTPTNAFIAQILRHAGMGDPTKPVATGVARGRFVVISAGKDGIFFSRNNGPGSTSTAVTNIITSDFNNGGNFGPTVVDTYDDIRIFGGS